MSQHLHILTGASRGMGLAMAQQLCTPTATLVCISRQASPALAQTAQTAGTTLLQWQHDLADATGVAQRLHDWLATQAPTVYASATLINNAGIMPPIAPLAASDGPELARALRVGLEAPLLLTGAFLGATSSWSSVARKVLNISSGLGRRPLASQTAYCAAKAGMDHFTRCLALEEAQHPHGARVCSLAPGVIDTDMQVQMRATDPALFPDVGTFNQLKSAGQLASTEQAAARVLAWLARPDFGQNPVADVRDA